MVDFIVEFIARSGYLGVFLLMALESIFPPIPSEMIMPFAGFVASKGVGAGFLLEKNYSAVARYVPPAAKTVVAVIVITYLYRFFTQEKGKK